MTPVKRRLLYIFRDTLLRIRISWPQGNALTLSTGYHIDRRKWDGARCTRNSAHGPQQISAATINRALQTLEDAISAAFYSFEAKDLNPTKAQLKEILNPKAAATPQLLAQLAETYIAQTAVLSQWSERTRRQNRQALNILIELFGPDARIDQMTDAHIVRLLDYMISRRVFLMKHLGEKTELRAGLNNNTINHYMTSIRSFATWSVKKGYVQATPLALLSKKLPVAKNPVIYLTLEELQRINALQLPPTQHLFRQAFLLSCFTGLRFSDLSTLRWCDIHADYIRVVTHKTHDLLEIDLNDHSRRLLDSLPHHGPDDLLFPMLRSNADYNKALKKIACKAGIDAPVQTVSYVGSHRHVSDLPKWQHVTSHTGRKTFVTLLLSLGVPPQIAMKWTGHKNYRSMTPYIDIFTDAKRAQMTRLNTLTLAPSPDPSPAPAPAPALSSPDPSPDSALAPSPDPSLASPRPSSPDSSPDFLKNGHNLPK